MNQGRKVGCQVARTEAHVGIVNLTGAAGVDPPGVRVPRRGDDARAFTTGLVQAAKAPQERVARRRKLWVWEHVTHSGEGAHVDVATDEVVLTKALQERGRSVTFLGDFVVEME